eukprot:CAMPEP_0204597176 /NCGR_PEP_ID=MMETSP0661-20131031/53663_1 /ASSEMBLY_ACC=CAM_ASM_000606 /TAXON_ID=109239 /ORGANISM="Alexandrium margalefi, Strain AMGDE01CS-322" /LENGTH=227 /DNA_ID=CAMNT_0051607855 /DNA_START=88 /DNA_END=767 /DNA_ORIENTATION=+
MTTTTSSGGTANPLPMGNMTPDPAHMSEKTTEVQAPPPRPSASVLPLFGQARGAPGPSGPSSDPSGLRSWPSGRSRSSNLASRLANAGACSAAVPGASSGAALGAMLQGRRASSAHCGLATPPGGTMPSATDILVRLGGRTLARLSLPEPRLGSWASSRSQAAFIGPEWPRSTSAESETGSSKLLLATTPGGDGRIEQLHVLVQALHQHEGLGLHARFEAGDPQAPR